MNYTEKTYQVSEQYPLDLKGWFKNIDDIRNPGADKYAKFFYYYSGMIAHDMETHHNYIWRESRLNEPVPGVLTTDFYYAHKRVTPFFDYTGKYFNFYPNIDFDLSLYLIVGEILTVTPGNNVVGPLLHLGNGTPKFKNLEVFLNGLLQRIGVNEDYTTTPSGLIIFNFGLSNDLGYLDKVTVNYLIN